MFYLIRHNPTDSYIFDMRHAPGYFKSVYYKFLDGKQLTPYQRKIVDSLKSSSSVFVYGTLEAAYKGMEFLRKISRVQIDAQTFTIRECSTWPLDACSVLALSKEEVNRWSASARLLTLAPQENERAPATYCNSCGTIIPNKLRVVQVIGSYICPLCLQDFAQSAMKEYEAYPNEENKRIFEQTRVLNNL